MSLGNFIEHVNPALAMEYRREIYLDKNANTKFSRPKPQELPKPVEKKKDDVRLLDQLMDRVSDLPDDNEAVIYCKERQIPEEKWDKIYYIPHICDIVQLSQKYKDKVTGKEPRLVFPFFNEKGRLTGVTCRAIKDSGLRYVTIKIAEDESMIFGVLGIDKTKTIYVTEGSIDSLFLDNSVAVGGSAMGKLSTINLPKRKMVIIFDNQPRNGEICGLIDKAIKNGYTVCIWPENFTSKDINEAVIDGYDIEDIKRMIDENTVSGLMAQLKFNQWKKC